MQSALKRKKVKTHKLVKDNEYTKRFMVVFSRHPSHTPLRRSVLLPFRSLLRLGSTTESIIKVQANSAEAVRNSADKRRMKNCFTQAKVKTAEWRDGGTSTEADIRKWAVELYPIVAKHRFGSRGTGNYLLETEAQLNKWFNGKDLSDYIFEKFYSYVREYRLHVTEDGCFYTCRKMLKNETADDKRWFRNDSNCVWIMETNPQFTKPSNWKAIEAECVKALKAVGLDIGAFDCRVQGPDKKEPQFIVLESNSAASFGTVTTQKYLAVLPKVLRKKFIESNS